MTFPAGDGQPLQRIEHPLTEREHTVLELVAEGNSNKLIAIRLSISERTVKNHLTSILTKLQAFDRTHAVVTAIRRGHLDITKTEPPAA